MRAHFCLSGLALAGLVACSTEPPPVAVDAGVVGDAGPQFRSVVIPGLPDPPPNFFDLWGTAPDQVWLVGTGGTVVRFDGQTWTQEPTPARTNLRGVFGLPPPDATPDAGPRVFAVGDEGTVLSRDPLTGTWAADPSTTAEDLRGLAGRGGADAELWAVGANGTIIRRDLSPAMPGGATPWVKVRSGTVENLGGLWVGGGGEVVAVGNLGVIMRGSATDAFRRQRVDGFVSPLQGVWGTAPDQLLFVGLDGKVLRQRGGEFEELMGGPAVYLRRVVGTSLEDAWITGWGGTLVSLRGNKPEAFNQFSDNRLEGIWLTQRSEPDPATDGGIRFLPQYWIVGVTGQVLIGP